MRRTWLYAGLGFVAGLIVAPLLWDRIGPGVPAITHFVPPRGEVGTAVVIYGSNFHNVTRVGFNDVLATDYTVDSPTQITAVVPKGATSGAIGVAAQSGGTVSTEPFVVAPHREPPTLSSFFPTG